MQAKSRAAERQCKRRNAILDIAHAAFLERGYAGATMSGISAMLGGSKSTLWAYFPTKQSLFAAVLIRAANALEAHLLASLNLEEGIEQRVRNFCEVYSKVICSPESIALHRLVVAEGVRFPEIGQTFFECAISATRQFLIRLFAEADRLEMLSVPEPVAAADLLRSLCHGNVFQSLIFNTKGSAYEPDPQDDAEIAATAFLRIFTIPMSST